MRDPRTNNLRIEIDYREEINFSLLYSGLESLVRKLELLNTSDETFGNISVSVRVPHLTGFWRIGHIKELKPGDKHVYSNVTPSPLMLDKLSSGSPVKTSVEVYLNERLQESRQAILLPLNAWDQSPGYEVALACFVFYLIEEISSVVRRGHQQPELILGRQGFPDLSPAEVAKAIYHTFKELCPSYAWELGCIGQLNQLIRFPDKLFKEWRGTCIDLALALAACVENIRRYSVIFIIEMRHGSRHALAGIWTLENPYEELPRYWNIQYPIPQAVIRNKKRVLELIEAKVLIPFDPDVLFKIGASFEMFVESGEKLIRDNTLSSMLDIESARQLYGVYPLPVSTSIHQSVGSLPAARNPIPTLSLLRPVDRATVPQDLKHSLEQRKCVLFIGDRLLSLNDRKGPLNAAQLARRLAQDCGYSETNTSLFEVAKYYERKFGREKLVKEAQNYLRPVAYSPPRVYQLIAKLPVDLVVSFYYDTMLEAALFQQKKPYVTVIKNEQIAGIDAFKIMLVKLYGCAKNGEPLVLTDDDWLGLLHNIPALSKFLKAHIASSTLLLLGCDLHDFNFKQLYREATRHVNFLTRRAYAVVDDEAVSLSYWEDEAVSLSYWEQEKMVIIKSDTELFIRSLLTDLSEETAAPAPAPAPVLVSQRPYKFLDYFDTEDEAIFFGREHETKEFYKELLASKKVVILCGKSGDGKTSLINAGIIPLLQREQHWRAIYTRCGNDVEQSIRRDLSRSLLESSITLKNPAGDLLSLLIDASAQTNQELVVIIDQFEEFFIKFGSAIQKAFFGSLNKCINHPQVACRFIIIIRDDYLAYLTEPEFTDRLTLIPHHTYRLPELSRAGALAAMTEPARRFGLAYEPELPENILDDLSPDTIVPAQLQIVCTKLYDALGEKETFSNELYEEIGRSRRILEEHLNEAFNQFNEEDTVRVRSILKAMVTSEATKDLLSLNQIVERTGIATVAVQQLLHQLIHRHRLIREVLSAELQYELSHEYIASAISDWIEEEERKLKEAQELLGREVANWQRFPDFVVEPDKLKIIDEWRAKLTLSNEAKFLILTSIFRHEVYEILDRHWLEQIKLLPGQLLEALLINLQEPLRRAIPNWQNYPWTTLLESLPPSGVEMLLSQMKAILELKLTDWGQNPGGIIDPDIVKIINTWRAELALNNDSYFLILFNILHHNLFALLDSFWIEAATLLYEEHKEQLLGSVTQLLDQQIPLRSSEVQELHDALRVDKMQRLLDSLVERWQESPSYILSEGVIVEIRQWEARLTFSYDAQCLILLTVLRDGSYERLASHWIHVVETLPDRNIEMLLGEVQKLLEQEVARCKETPDAFIEPTKLRIIQQWSTRLTLSDDDIWFILSSIIRRQSFEMLNSFWIMRASLLSTEHADTLMRAASQVLRSRRLKPSARHLLRLQEALMLGKAQRLLEGVVTSRQESPDFVVEPDKLKIIDEWRAELTLSTEAKVLILSSIIRQESYETLNDFWVEQAGSLPAADAGLLLNDVQDLLGREVKGLQSDYGFIIEKRKLIMIHQWSEKLMLNNDARHLILSSVFCHELYEFLNDFWIGQAGLLPIGSEEMITKEVQELLSREAASWRRSPEFVVEPYKLKIIDEWRAKLTLSTDIIFLILSSILRHEAIKVMDDYWIEQGGLLPAQQAEALLKTSSDLLIHNVDKQDARRLHKLQTILQRTAHTQRDVSEDKRTF